MPIVGVMDRKTREFVEEYAKQRLTRVTFSPSVLRYRRYAYLGVVAQHRICQQCHAPCCRVSQVNIVLTFVEWARYLRGKLNWRVRVFYPGRYRQAGCDVSDEDAKFLDEAIMKPKGERFIRPPKPRYRRVGDYRISSRTNKVEQNKIQVYLAKKPNGACIYLNETTGACAIYANRPHACKTWFCDRGSAWDTTWQRMLEYEKQDDDKLQEHSLCPK